MNKITVFSYLLLFWAAVASAQDNSADKGAFKRDPFIPLITPEGRLLDIDASISSDVKLEGIIFDPAPGKSSFALINGKVVKSGDEINGYAVIRVEDNKVVLTRDGQAKELALNTFKEGEIDQTAAKENQK